MESKLRLDLGCGQNLQKGWVGMDVRPLDLPEERFIHHDIETFPWPLEDDSCAIVLASHILEHVSPVVYSLEQKERYQLVKQPGIVAIMNEMWRVLEPDGQAQITGPYGWSHGFVQDPTHTKPLNETTFAYFTPKDWIGNPCQLHEIYNPKPWRWVEPPRYATGGNFIVILEAIK